MFRIVCICPLTVIIDNFDFIFVEQKTRIMNICTFFYIEGEGEKTGVAFLYYET